MAQFGAEEPGGQRSDLLPRVTLILGGARSGKSRVAEALIEERLGVLYTASTYIATAEALDAEMAERIAKHRSRRGPLWHTVEAPIDIADALGPNTGPERPVLIDCLTLWLSNIMQVDRDIERETTKMLSALHSAMGPVLLIANEVGFGIVPENALARRFRDEAGLLNQAVAEVADRVILVAAGLPLVLKGDMT